MFKDDHNIHLLCASLRCTINRLFSILNEVDVQKGLDLESVKKSLVYSCLPRIHCTEYSSIDR